jgi:hypothetical protein
MQPARMTEGTQARKFRRRYSLILVFLLLQRVEMPRGQPRCEQDPLLESICKAMALFESQYDCHAQEMEDLKHGLQRLVASLARTANSEVTVSVFVLGFSLKSPVCYPR